jgi:hypothetical protein
MKAKNATYGKYEDESGEEYYCPLIPAENSHVESDWALDNCVEASTVGRYSGNLNVADRFTS